MTQLSFDAPGQHLYVRSVDARGVRLGEQWFPGPLILTADECLENWGPAKLADITDDHLEKLLEFNPEVVLLGTGARQSFLHPERLAVFYRQQVGIELMTTEAACRTFNVLVSEGRKAVAGLLPPGAS